MKTGSEWAAVELAFLPKPRYYQCVRCGRSAQIRAYDGLCHWCWERHEAGGFRSRKRDPNADRFSDPRPIPFEPSSGLTRFLGEIMLCTLIGVLFVGAIRFITATRLHGLDLQGLLPLATLPHVACFAWMVSKVLRALRRRLGGWVNRWIPWEIGVALALTVTLTVVSWQSGPQWLLRAASQESVAYELLNLFVGVDVDARDSRGFTALTYAAESGDISAMRYLLDHAADVDRTDTAGTPLTHAAAKGQLDAVRLLLDHGANINATNRHGLTPLELARKHGRVEVAEFLARFTQ